MKSDEKEDPADRRRVERRRMPGEVRALVDELRAISRRSGAQTADGTEWRTIPRFTVDTLVDVLIRSYRSDDHHVRS